MRYIKICTLRFSPFRGSWVFSKDYVRSKVDFMKCAIFRILLAGLGLAASLAQSSNWEVGMMLKPSSSCNLSSSTQASHTFTFSLSFVVRFNILLWWSLKPVAPVFFSSSVLLSTLSCKGLIIWRWLRLHLYSRLKLLWILKELLIPGRVVQPSQLVVWPLDERFRLHVFI